MSDQQQPDVDGPPQVEMMEAPPPVSPELRAKILADPNVAKLAKELGQDLETYVNTIGFYINNPDVQPALLQASDEDLRKVVGIEPPTFEAITASLKASNDAFMAGQAPSGFEDQKRAAMAIPKEGGDQPLTPGTVDPKLADAVKKGRFPSKG